MSVDYGSGPSSSNSATKPNHRTSQPDTPMENYTPIPWRCCKNPAHSYTSVTGLYHPCQQMRCNMPTVIQSPKELSGNSGDDKKRGKGKEEAGRDSEVKPTKLRTWACCHCSYFHHESGVKTCSNCAHRKCLGCNVWEVPSSGQADEEARGRPMTKQPKGDSDNPRKGKRAEGDDTSEFRLKFRTWGCCQCGRFHHRSFATFCNKCGHSKCPACSVWDVQSPEQAIEEVDDVCKSRCVRCSIF